MYPTIYFPLPTCFPLSITNIISTHFYVSDPDPIMKYHCNFSQSVNNLSDSSADNLTHDLSAEDQGPFHEKTRYISAPVLHEHWINFTILHP